MAFGKGLELIAQCVKRFNEQNKETPKKPRNRFSSNGSPKQDTVTHSNLMANCIA